MKPRLGKKIEFKATLEEKPEDGDSGFSISWRDFHPKIKSKVSENDRCHLDDRTRTINKCKYWKELRTNIKGNLAKINVDSTVPHDSWEDDTNSKEIYAAIRAEYKYVVHNKYKKLGSRFDGSNGIDHLFIHDKNKPLIVESKTITNLSKVTKLIERKNHNAIIDCLAKGRRVNGGVAIATQMSKKWVLDCIVEISNKLEGEVKNVAKNILTDIKCNRSYPDRILNVYGGLDWNANGLYDELVAEAERQFSELEEKDRPKITDRTLTDVTATKYTKRTKHTSKGQLTGVPEFLFIWREWRTYNPEKGRFYLLPGIYSLRNRSDQFVGKVEEAEIVDFADRQYKNEEFFNLDKLSLYAIQKLDKLKVPKKGDGRDTRAINQAASQN